MKLCTLIFQKFELGICRKLLELDIQISYYKYKIKYVIVYVLFLVFQILKFLFWKIVNVIKLQTKYF